MSEDEARAWVAARWGSAAVGRLEHYVELVRSEASAQNLVAPSTLDCFWSRHIADSAQLVGFADRHPVAGDWADIGSGAGLPGIVAAILQSRPVLLIEPRRRRADFLDRVVETLALSCRIVRTKVEAMHAERAAVISARAVASLDQLLFLSTRLASESSLWLLPRGRSAQSEVDAAKCAWHGVFHVEQSITQSDSLIVIAQGVRAR